MARVLFNLVLMFALPVCQFIGLKRYTEPLCKIEDILEHFTCGRLLHQGKTLPLSWAIEAKGEKAYFAIDIGYLSVEDGEDEVERLLSLVFKEIGEHFSGFNLAMIPMEYMLFLFAFHHLMSFQGAPAKVSSIIDG
ncbi:hypothetical protein ARMGADRAFT_1039627 [Armillaria gallica]|uniref:Uncharacterized protein n=1 Tax=Armillaria gallica TaxID=47427 RepID=A0A2H3CD68_ARMGA|nr:hypothetical protein ARMGADRAFT_1039627 [Armillaria gallica]